MEFTELSKKYKDLLTTIPSPIAGQLHTVILMEILEELKLLNKNLEPKVVTKKATTAKK